MDILDVDLLAFETGDRQRRQGVIDGVMRSLVTGFVFVEHDVPDDLLDHTYAQLEAFFALPRERKEAYQVAGARGQAGYTGLLVETAASSETPDWKEMLNWGSTVPAGHPLAAKFPHRYLEPVLPEAELTGIAELLLTFHDRILDLQRRVLRVIAAGLHADEHYFDSMIRNGATLTRAIHYPAMDLAPGTDHVWAGEHGDINLITALPRATAAGLQVKADDGWIDAVPPEGSAIVNTGMMLEHLTNGVIPTGVHRVVADSSQSGDRYSVVQFCHPEPWTLLTPMPSCVTEENPLRYPTVSAADRLDQVLWEINLVEDARRVD